MISESLCEELQNSLEVKQEPISPCAVVQVPQIGHDLIEHDPGNTNEAAELQILQLPEASTPEAKLSPQPGKDTVFFICTL